ncbi:response regulator [Endozoicomonas sp. SM1973]|uniref:Sensory/regulatory protein RpfC n=1 Tax=Spartinivicinus marinus TaxID=2994442 RepID=A0A853I7V1_9GAMM|nr:response regulator [Spartinivicinus marinus]MCX4026927.1 ATP-binding protein [Spartinivicinus marinus]NYZ66728.1 response regulator [Spartinivicinus marinus]
MANDEVWLRRLNRERAARQEAERLLEEKSRQLYEINEKLKTQQIDLKEKALKLAEAKDKAVAASEAKSTFLAQMSHEIRTPMNGILGMAQLLALSQLSSEQQEQVEVIRRSTEALLNILNDILDYSKINSGKYTLVEKNFNLFDLMSQIVSTIAPIAEKKLISIGCAIEQEVPLKLTGDEGRLRQVILNLLTNAIKFTDKGGIYIHIRTLEKNQQTTTLHFSIEDTGRGIAKHNQQKLFTEFQQVHNIKHKPVEGTGLGLAISKGLVQLMQGSIGFKSTEGKGSTFWFSVSLPPIVEGWHMAQYTKVPVIAWVTDNILQKMFTIQCEACNRQVIFIQNKKILLSELQKFKIAQIWLDLDIITEQDLESLSSTKQLQQYLIITIKWPHRSKNKLFPQAQYNLLKPLRPNTFINLLLGKPYVYERDEQEPSSPSILEQLPSLAPILVVDDNATNLMITTKMLNKIGFSCLKAENGQQAIDIINSAELSLILMDIQMPVMDGIEATQVIRRTNLSKLPIIALTANAMEGDQEEYLAAGMNDYLTKPVKLEQLQQVLKRWLL